MNVFIVEDNPLNAELAAKLLEDEGFGVTHFTLAEEALEQLQTEQPDIVLMDMNLPGMNGYDAAAQIVGSSQTHTIPVIAFTAMALSGEADMALKAGCRGVIYKPIDVMTFAETVANFARQHQADTALDSVDPHASDDFTADQSRLFNRDDLHSTSMEKRISQLSHDTLNQISILKHGLFYLQNSADVQLGEKQKAMLNEMEKATESLRTISRFMMDVLGKRNN